MGLLQHRDAARRWFSLLAPGYDDVVAPLFWPDSIQREGVSRLDLGESDRVLDVGCGTGETTRHLLERAGEVHGLEVSDEQLAIVSRKSELEATRLVRADAHRLPYGDETFDAVVSVGSILYWQDPGEALGEANRIAKPGGEILVMGFNRRSPSAWNPVRNYQVSVNAALFFQASPAETTDFFEEAGWQAIDHEITGPSWAPELVLTTTGRKPR